MFFVPDEILCRYKILNLLIIGREFKEAELHARSIFERRSHQKNDAVEGVKGEILFYANTFPNSSSLSRHAQVFWQVLAQIGGVTFEITGQWLDSNLLYLFWIM